MFRLPATHKEKLRWCSTPLSMAGLRCPDFLLLSAPRIQGPMDICIESRAKRVAVDQVLKQCAVQLGSPPGILCGTIQDLCRCLVPLIEKDDLIDTSMLEVAEEEPMTSSNTEQEAEQWGAEPELQEELATTLHTPTDLKRLQSLRELSVSG